MKPANTACAIRSVQAAAIVCLAAVLANPLPAQSPPRPPGQLVELVKLDPTLRLDIRYATDRNFTGKAVYPEARAFLRHPAAEALVAAHRWLNRRGLGLIIYDAYRPWSVTKLFWDVTPPAKRKFVANPSKGSHHNRGCAVDVGLFDLRTGREVEMPGSYDEMSERSSFSYQGGTAEQRARRDLLRKVMEREGFQAFAHEWWHYTYRDCRKHAVLDLPFSQLGTGAEAR
jgi:D-alanyl-D-alanine dipeptidase